MLILVLDSCGSSCGVGVFEDEKTLACAQENMQRGQDARLMPMIVAALAQTGRDFSDLDRVAVTRGPGSFTGVRVGLAAAHGIGLASGKPVIGIDRFSIYRALYKDPSKNLLVVIDSKRAELFCRFFHSHGQPDEPCMMTEDEIRAFLAAHPGTEVAGDIATPDDECLAACARLAQAADTQNPEFLPRPLYIRAPDVTFAAAKS
jgi:tRNA threonylcarbamoyladenosine biosynthesis protein TsaB